MDFDPKHDQSLDLPLSFPGDPVDRPPSATAATTAAAGKLKSQEQQQKKQQQQRPQSRQKQPSPSPAEPRPTYTIYIRVPAPRNGFVDPPDVNWSREKDDALWRILSRASKNDIDWEQLAEAFEATVDFLLIQATILTERHVSQVRAQTRKVATQGGGGGGGGGGTRDSPMHSPARQGNQSPGVRSSRRAATPTSEAMGRTLSGGGVGQAAGGRVALAETMRRTASAGSRAGPRAQGRGSGAGTPSVGGGSGSRRPSMEDSQIRPTRPLRPSLESIPSFVKDGNGPAAASPVGKGHPTFSPATAQLARLQSPLPIHPARPTDVAGGGRDVYETEGEEEDEEGADLESPAAASSQSSGSSSSTPSEPVMSRIFKRPPGYPPQQQPPQQQQQRRDVLANNRQRGPMQPSSGGDTEFGGIGLGISSGGSDDGDESETQAAFLPFKSPTLAATAAATASAAFTEASTSRKATATSGSIGSGSRHRQQQHQHQHQRRQQQQQRRPNADDQQSSSSPSSSASVSPTTKAFKTPTVAAAAAAAAATAASTAGSPSTASAMAAARLQSSRLPGMRSPPRLQHALSGKSAAALAKAAAAAGAAPPGISREGSETGTTPSIGSSFSDLEDVSFTQSVLDEALGSKVEDTVVTPNPNNNTDTMSSSATRRLR